MFTHTLLCVTAHFTPSLLTLYSGFIHTFLSFIHILLKVYLNFSSILLILYSGFTQNFSRFYQQVFITLYTRSFSHFILSLLTLYCRLLTLLHGSYLPLWLLCTLPQVYSQFVKGFLLPFCRFYSLSTLDFTHSLLYVFSDFGFYSHFKLGLLTLYVFSHFISGLRRLDSRFYALLCFFF